MNDTTHELLARLIQQDLIARLMQKVEDTMCDADVDFPAGREAGARVSYNSDSLQRCFEVEMEAAPDLHRIVTEQATQIERLRGALVLCQDEIDDYIQKEYPGAHPVQERYRQRDFASNPARTALAVKP